MSTVTVAVKIDFGFAILDEAGRYINDEANRRIIDNQLVDMANTDLLNSVPLSYKRGTMSNELRDRIGDIGTANFALNNSDQNSAGVAGYYSPGHVNARANWGLDKYVEIDLTSGGTTLRDWYGRITAIQPTPGIYGERLTAITAEDWMAYAAETPIRGITTQTSKRDDQLLTTLLTLSPEQPLSTDFDTGDDTYTYALNTENSDEDYLLTLMQKISDSGFGKLFLRGSTASPEVLRYISRSGVLLSTSPVATFDDTIHGLEVTHNRRRRVKTVIVKTYPVEVDASNVVLWVSQREIPISAGETVTMDVNFRDPNGKAVRVSAWYLEPASASTDFNFSSTSGSGSDLDASLSVVYDLQSDIATVTLTNNSVSNGYLLEGYQIRGKATYVYEPHSSVVDTGQPNGETLLIEMPYQDDIFVGDDIAGLVAGWFATDVTYIDSISYIANYNTTLMTAALTVQPGDLIQVSETQTGITAETYFVQGYEKTIQGGVLRVTYALTPANQISGVFVLNTSALDVDILGA